MSNKNILIVQALQDERIELPPIPGTEVRRIFSGCGKVAGASAVMRAIFHMRPDAIINIGTAGTANKKVGDIVLCDTFVDRDLKPLSINGVESEAKSDTNHPLLQQITSTHQLETCSTGDSFVTTTFTDGVVCDMEAFAEALVCLQERIPFLAIKYVTDIVGQNSVAVWEDKLADARRELTNFLHKALA